MIEFVSTTTCFLPFWSNCSVCSGAPQGRRGKQADTISKVGLPETTRIFYPNSAGTDIVSDVRL
jgi:hypothetical protein